ncbi:dynamin family protein [Clostridium sp. MCC353]|uniref:dynamin family protein n=1 Tax=Clostridium sp. MCC353 TaxID=2592646 RepID=UPI001C01F7FC|nr:dynamin family protein [Clostridium sp. MCC353]
MIDTFRQYWEAEENIGKIGRTLMRAERVLHGGESETVRTLKALEGIMDRKYVVLVCGLIKSGKSSVINGLIGEKLLDEEILPTVPSVYELHYGDEKKIAAYMWENGQWDESRAIYVKPTAEGILKFKERLGEFYDFFRNNCEFPVCKLVIYWPSDLLESGLVLVEAPYTSQQNVCWPIREYLPYADAVIYAVNMNVPYIGMDLEYLSEINSYGVERIVSVFTRCDIMEAEDEDDDGPGDEETGGYIDMEDDEPDDFDEDDEFEDDYNFDEIRQYLMKRAQEYSSLGPEAVHFVKNRVKNGRTMWQDEEIMGQSGYPELKSYLNRLLIQECAVPRLMKGMRLLNEIIMDLKGNSFYRGIITPDMMQKIQSLWKEVPVAPGELADQGFMVLDRVIPSLEPELAKKYDLQEKELYDKYQNPELHLAVIGNFSCGKSTFLNAVLKQELLSTDNLPTTALPTYIRWDKTGGNEPEITAEDVEGERFRLLGPELSRFEVKTGITLPKETGAMIDSLTTDSGLIGKVKRIELSFPEEEKYENFCIIDTPGVNPGQEDAREHILETQSILRKEADAAIVLFPALQVYTADFENFLMENAAHLMDDSIFIITKMDMVRRESERAELLAYVKRLLQKNFELQEPEVYGISAGFALDYYMDEAVYAGDKQWAMGFEEVMEKVFQKLRDRRQEIISGRISEMVRELIHLVGDEVKKDTKRLEDDREKLHKYSLDSLEKSYQVLLSKYEEDLLVQEPQWISSMNEILTKRIKETEEEIDYNIDRQRLTRGLKAYVDCELNKAVADMNYQISQDINKNIIKKIRKRGYEFITEVKACLEEYQYYVSSAGDFFNKQKDSQKHPALVLNDISIEPKEQMPSLIDAVIQNLELGSILGALLMPLLAVGFILEQQMLPKKKIEIKMKIMMELSGYYVSLKSVYTVHVNTHIKKNIDWAKSLLAAYQDEYKLFFEKKNQEFQEKEKIILKEIKKNQVNLENMELIEPLLQKRKRGIDHG